MPLIDQLESKVGRLAIPGLIQAVAILQIVVWVAALILPVESRDTYIALLALDGGRILQGEVWRLLSFIFVPQNINVIFMLIAVLFLMWIGRGLEQAWGAFRVNLYFFAGMAGSAAAALLFGAHSNNFWLFQTLLFAFACFYPNEEILLFFILPVKIKWIAMFAGALTILSIVLAPQLLLPVLLAHANFLLVFGPPFIRERLHMAKVSQRRSRFEAARVPESAHFHQCSVCQKTEQDDPTLEFRVTDSGDEVCSACRGKSTASSTAPLETTAS